MQEAPPSTGLPEQTEGPHNAGGRRAPEVADLVKAADPEPVAHAIPAGLPPDLLRSVILVYSDLASRRYAMASFDHTPPGYPLRRGEILEQVLLSQLGNGHEAAARFDADLAATQSLAAATPPIDAVPADSRLVAEKLLLIQDVGNANAGCNARGGVVTKLPEIIWGPVPGMRDADGTIGRPGFVIAFTTDFGPDSIWHVAIIAC